MRPGALRRDWSLPVAVAFSLLSALWATVHLQEGGSVFPQTESIPAAALMAAALVLFARAWLAAGHLILDGEVARDVVADAAALLMGTGAYVVLGVATLFVMLVYSALARVVALLPTPGVLDVPAYGATAWAMVVANWPVMLVSLLLCPVGVVPCGIVG